MSDYYDSIVSDVNNMSYWLPKIQHTHPFDTFRIPKTAIVKVPEEIFELFFMEKKGMTQQQIMFKIMEWVKDEFVPQATNVLGEGIWFIKNGGYSNKFDFSTCKNVSSNLLKLTANIIDIQYNSLMFDTGGNAELIARDYIPAPQQTPTIYNGMPLRNEIRVFYDFDNHRTLYTANYWDWDYCHEAISKDPTDKIVYEHQYPVISGWYDILKDEIIPVANYGLCDVTELKGIWSVDFMQDEGNHFWLIDMATGPTSAYWDLERVQKARKELGLEG